MPCVLCQTTRVLSTVSFTEYATVGNRLIDIVYVGPPCTHIHTPRGNLVLPIHILACFWNWEETSDPRRKPQPLKQVD